MGVCYLPYSVRVILLASFFWESVADSLCSYLVRLLWRFSDLSLVRTRRAADTVGSCSSSAFSWMASPLALRYVRCLDPSARRKSLPLASACTLKLREFKFFDRLFDRQDACGVQMMLINHKQSHDLFGGVTARLDGRVPLC